MTSTTRKTLDDGSVNGDWWHLDQTDGRIVCDLCPRECHLKDGDRGFCFVRENRDNQMVLSTYGRSTGFCIDPIEKKPLNHFYPGTSVLSFGTAGCNLGCKFCQNWDISKSREIAKLSQYASPSFIVEAAKAHACESIAFTYNDPVIWAEYAIDTAKECRDAGIKSVAVTAGYISPQARGAFYEFIDAANVDLKAFSEDFYWKITNSHLAPVLDTLKFLKHETNVWFEITNLVIPQTNDSLDEFSRMVDWVLTELGDDVPIHFTAFHPDFRMRDLPPTPHQTLIQAFDIAKKAGLKHPYIGNVHDSIRQSTYCSQCNSLLIERNWYSLGEFAIHDGKCRKCGNSIAGRFHNQCGQWGNRRQLVDLNQFRTTIHPTVITPTTKTKPTQMNATTISTECIDANKLTSEERKTIVDTAAQLITHYAHHRQPSSSVVAMLGHLAAQKVYGIFTTLKRGSQLRGCCGTIGSLQPLGEALVNACRRTTLDDVRMPPISPSELAYLDLDVSLLGELENIPGDGTHRAESIEIGKHGLRIQRGNQAGLLLPTVSTEQGWNVTQFLEGVCRKAGLPANAWSQPDVLLQRFPGTAIHKKMDIRDLSGWPLRRPRLLNEQQLSILQTIVSQNILAILNGATPTYFIPDVPDGDVQGIILSFLSSSTSNPLMHIIQMSLRPGVPLQSSLFELTRTAAKAMLALKQNGQLQVQIGLTVLQDPIAHATVQSSQIHTMPNELLEDTQSTIPLSGIIDNHRAIVAIANSNNVAVVWDENTSPVQCLKIANEVLGSSPSVISVYSMEYISTHPMMIASNKAIPDVGAKVRLPAVAGTFYPASDADRDKMVEQLIAPYRASSPKPAIAVMTPHAGLVYSGNIAANVWSNVAIPSRVLIIGPKHTSSGVALAVAPYETWQLSPNVGMRGDSSFSTKLANSLTGFQLDSGAHQREHGIEVQLPFLHRLANATQISAIAMASVGWEQIRIAAKQLAELLAAESEPPLLVISSDMNHFEEYAENQRRDRMALDAIFTKSPEQLLDVCRQNQISMCGVIPAALVMQTLIEWGKGFDIEELGYETSADAMRRAVAKGEKDITIDNNRVVGYAGLAFRESMAN